MAYVEVQQEEGFRKIGSIYLCLGCDIEIGKLMKKYCEYCGTIAGREKRAEENDVIDKRFIEMRAGKLWIYEDKPVTS